MLEVDTRPVVVAGSVLVQLMPVLPEAPGNGLNDSKQPSTKTKILE